MPGHGTALAHDVKADRELAAAQHRVGCALDEGQGHRVAQHALARLHRRVPFRPPNRTAWLVPLTSPLLASCSPTKASLKVTGWVPKTFDSRMRVCWPHTSGRTIMRKV